MAEVFGDLEDLEKSFARCLKPMHGTWRSSETRCFTISLPERQAALNILTAECQASSRRCRRFYQVFE